MYGAIFGDLAGSIYEYDEFQDGRKKTINLKRRLSVFEKELITNECFYSDDTILTIAILDSILNNIPYEINLKKYGLENRDIKNTTHPYFHNTFSPTFLKWCNGLDSGLSKGNGALMRISPVGYLFNSEKDVKEQSFLATIPSHFHLLSINYAQIVALMIYYYRKYQNKKEVFKIIKHKYELNLNYCLETLQMNHIFEGTCDVLPILLYILNISNSFEESIRKTLSIGGDTDTNACIVGSIAEAFYGIPNEYITKINEFIPQNYQNLLNEGYKRIKVLK